MSTLEQTSLQHTGCQIKVQQNIISLTFTCLNQSIASTKAADLIRFLLKGKWVQLVTVIWSTYSMTPALWHLLWTHGSRSLPKALPANYYILDAVHSLLLFKQKLLLLHWEIRDVRAPSDQKQKGGNKKQLRNSALEQRLDRPKPVSHTYSPLFTHTDWV